MRNQRMQDKLKYGKALAVDDEGERMPNGHWKLRRFVDDKDYCVRVDEAWIWSIGRHLATGEIHASTSSEYYQNPDYECLFLR